MNCFIHDRAAAIGVCSLCQKAVCRDCVGRETPRLVCRTCLDQRPDWPLVHICAGVDPVTMRPRVAKGVIAIGNMAVGSVAVGGAAIGFVYAIGGGAFGPAIINGRRCDPAAAEFVRQWLGSGALPPSCR